MGLPIDASFVCPILIGRADIVARLDDYINAARNGVGHVTFIAGEAGIGKSRLLAEAKASANKYHFLVVQGRCFDLDQAIPFAPIIELLRGLSTAAASADVVRSLIANRSEFARLLPELGIEAPDTAKIPDLNFEQERRHLFDLLTQFFLRLASRLPLLMTIEDLHWIDSTSLEFLAYFARRAAQARIIVLLTYRSDEASPELLSFLADLERERLANEFALMRLTRDETVGLLKGMLGAGIISAEVADSIYALTEGNPFFVEEIAKSMVTTGKIVYSGDVWRLHSASESRLPRTVQVAVQQRLKLLSPAAHDVLVLAAVAGRRFNFLLLQELTGHSENMLIGLIKEMINAQLVVEETGEIFAFRHALTREAVYLSLLLRERCRFHSTVAAAMEQHYADALDAHYADLTYQYYQAQVWAKVLEFAPRAAEQAQNLCSPRAAVSLYTQAVEAAQHSGLSLPWGVYRGRGIAYETIGEFEAAHQDYSHAMGIAHELQMEWQSTLDLGFLWTGKDFDRAGSYFQQALDLARKMDDAATLGHSLNRLGNWYQNHLEQPEDSRHYHREALSAFQKINDVKGVAASLDLLGTSSYFCGDILAGATYYEEAIALFRKLNDRQGMLSSLVMFATRGANYLHDTVVCPVTDLAAATQDAELAVQLAHDAEWQAGESFALSYLTFGLGAQGVYAPALRAAHAALDLAAGIDHDFWTAAAHLALGTLYLDLLDFPQAREHLEQSLNASRRIATQFIIRMSSAFLASATLRQNEFARAAEVLNAALSQDQPIQTLARRRIQLARAELALASGDGEGALQAVDRLVGPEAIPSVSYLRGKTLLALGRLEEADTDLRAAQDGARAHGLRPLLWRIHASHARLCEVQHDLAGVSREIKVGKSIVAELAAGIPDSAVREHFSEQAIAMFPEIPEESARQTAQHYFDGLTRREREIAVLTARGRSNREIATELVISERTVDTHISNILSKLGFNSRRQIAQWVAEKGLASTR